jgi:drug/metabolite transporter (DMT)-like permease
LLVYLVTNPLWLLSIVVGAVAWLLHVAALKAGSIAIVQPVIVSGIVLSLPLRAALDRRLPSRRDLTLVAVTAIGLAAFLLAANPTSGEPSPDRAVGAVLTASGLVAAVIVILATIRVRSDKPKAFLLGAAAGLMFGLAAGLIKVVVGTFDSHVPLRSLESWPLWALVLGGGVGVALNQNAYQIAPLCLSMPILNIVAVLVALLFGVLVFGEALAQTPGAVTLEALSLGCMAIGLREIARPA